jgi:hypothetical protein
MVNCAFKGAGFFFLRQLSNPMRNIESPNLP